MKQLSSGAAFGFYITTLFTLLIILPRALASILLMSLVFIGFIIGMWQWKPVGNAPIGFYKHAPTIAVLSVIIAIFAAVILRPLNFDEGLIATGLVILLILLMGTLPPSPIPAYATPSHTLYTINRSWLMGSIALVGIVTASNIRLITLPTWLQILLFCLGLCGFVLAFGTIKKPHLNREAWLVILLVIAAFIIRVIDLQTLVDRYVDEKHSLVAIINLWDNPNTPFLTQYGEITAFTWIYPAAQSVTVTIFGNNLLGLRFVSVCIGALNVAALWWLASLLFDKRVAWIAAIALAVFPPHIHFSRLGLNNVADPLFATVAFAFLAKIIIKDEGSGWNFAAAGVLLGCTQLFYEGGRLVYPPVALAWIILWGLQTRKSFPWRGVLILFAGFLLVAIPVYWTLLNQDLRVTPRLSANIKGTEYWSDIFYQDGGIGILIDILRGLQDTLWMLVQHPDDSWFYSSRSGVVIPWMLPFFLLGAAYGIWRLNKPGFALLFLWVMVVIGGNALLYYRFESPRYVAAYPAIAVLIGVGVMMLRRKILITGAVVFIAFAGVSYYFQVEILHFNSINLVARSTDDAVERSLSLPDHTSVYFVQQNGFFMHEFEYLLRFAGRSDADITYGVVPVDEMNQEFIENLPDDRTIALFIHPNVREPRELIEQFTEPIFSTSSSLPVPYQYALYLLEPDS